MLRHTPAYFYAMLKLNMLPVASIFLLDRIQQKLNQYHQCNAYIAKVTENEEEENKKLCNVLSTQSKSSKKMKV